MLTSFHVIQMFQRPFCPRQGHVKTRLIRESKDKSNPNLVLAKTKVPFYQKLTFGQNYRTENSILKAELQEKIHFDKFINKVIITKSLYKKKRYSHLLLKITNSYC